MTNLQDVYYKVGKDLFEHNFNQQDNAMQKKMVEASLKNYMAGKIAGESIEKAIELSENPNVSMHDLIIMLGELIPRDKHFDTIRHLTHFMLNIAGEMQGRSITWWEDDNVEYIDNQMMTFSEDGKVDSLTTHSQTSYVQTFRFVFEIFQSSFMAGKKDSKQLILENKPTNESNK